jgi:hypothetical protein
MGRPAHGLRLLIGCPATSLFRRKLSLFRRNRFPVPGHPLPRPVRAYVADAAEFSAWSPRRQVSLPKDFRCSFP